MRTETKPISVGDITIRPNEPVVMAGPCAVESEEQTLLTAKHVVSQGAVVIRGGAYKPRSDPDSFQGLGEVGLEILFKAGRDNGVPVVTEVMDKDQIETIKRVSCKHPFILQIGTRNALNYSLLKSVGETGIPVLLKRGMGSTVCDMINASRYVTRGGSPVLMCERGIATLSDAGRYTPDFNAVLMLQEKNFLTIFDPSHPAGRNDWVTHLALAGIAVGASGLLVEVNPTCEAKCDGKQSLNFEQFTELMEKVKALTNVIHETS
jgi:3-deoxy-7-phosphoheptulonate synthase